MTSYFKGEALLKSCKQAGCRVILVTLEKLADEDWPWDSIDEFYKMPSLHKRPDVIHAISYLARTQRIDQILPLDDYDVEIVASLREHMRLPGLGDTLARHFRDKLAMRTQAYAHEVPVPNFTGIFNHDRLREFMERVPPPWLVKPRSEASSMGIKKIEHPDQLWALLETLGDQQSFFLMERYLPGDVFHVDGLVVDGAVVFSNASQYGRPPLDVYQGGGVFITRTVERSSPDAQALLALNARVLKALGISRGATHVEFIKARDNGQFYFLECAARVGGAHIAEAVEFATGVNLWAEWARIEVASLRGEAYPLPPLRNEYSGVVNCLARQQWPDTSAYNDPEIKWRLHKEYHAGLIVAAPDAARVEALLDAYSRRFAEDFLAVAPPLEKAPD
jgi:biotin carboxylase